MTAVERLFRQARPAGFAWNYGKTLAQTLVFWGFFLVLLPAVVARFEDGLGLWRFEPSRVVAAGGFVLFGSLGLTSGYFMARAGKGTPLPVDGPRHLVVVGPYRYLRNPMAVAGLLQGLMTALWFGSPLVVGYVVIGGVLWNRFIRPPEEDDLLRNFGLEFEAYRRAVRCWIPRLTPYRPSRLAD